MSGQLAPVALILVGFVLYLFKSVYGEVLFSTLVTGPRRSLSLKLSGTSVYEP